MNQYLEKLIHNFKSKDFKNFAAYVHTTLQKEIDISKGKQKDKYIQIRKSILNYIFSNERSIVSELNKKIRK
jgi:hypothetical protein